ncbi:uncharacterized protein G2W53_031584 [Senna tora]|uniref:Uncharacterized protein n=1 Tax=Senna tora TaxID=362788 RepID=A0A834TA20_9FABA|nr:uncharacterized protein G2W53_031584 [Senna tora]
MEKLGEREQGHREKGGERLERGMCAPEKSLLKSQPWYTKFKGSPRC